MPAANPPAMDMYTRLRGEKTNVMACAHTRTEMQQAHTRVVQHSGIMANGVEVDRVALLLAHSVCKRRGKEMRKKNCKTASVRRGRTLHHGRT